MARVAQKPGPGRAPLVTAIKRLDGERGKVGWFESAKYEDGTPVAYVATIQEYGFGPIPPRPFMRPTAEEKQKTWTRNAADISRAIVRGQVSDGLMETLGSKAAGDVRKYISKITSPALSPITLYLRRKRKEGAKITGKTVGEAAKAVADGQVTQASASEAKPLNDTGYMLATLTHTVERTK